MRYLILVTVLLLGVSWVAAQNDSTQANPNGSAQTSVQGCLSGSNGSYVLTDKNGTAYQLTGNTAKLSDHVGHEVKITGTTASASASSSGGAMGSSGSGAQQTLEVSSMKHISKTCQSSGMSH